MYKGRGDFTDEYTYHYSVTVRPVSVTEAGAFAGMPETAVSEFEFGDEEVEVYTVHSDCCLDTFFDAVENVIDYKQL